MIRLDYFILLILCIVSYLIASINFAIIVSNIYLKDDIRKYGSKSAGMSNVLRTIGKKAAFFIVIGDTLKGYLPVFITKIIYMNYIKSDIDPIFAAYLIGFFAIIGHTFPIYYGFKGGKGILTAAGAMICIDFLVFFILLIIFLILSFSTRIISIGSITISMLLPFITFTVQKIQNRFTLINFYCTMIIGFMLLFTHRENIKRLLNGTENKFHKNR